MSSKKDSVFVTLQVGEELFAFAQVMADWYGYDGPVDYLNGLLNTAILGALDKEDWVIDYGPIRPAPDMDDDIPF